MDYVFPKRGPYTIPDDELIVAIVPIDEDTKRITTRKMTQHEIDYEMMRELNNPHSKSLWYPRSKYFPEGG